MNFYAQLRGYLKKKKKQNSELILLSARFFLFHYCNHTELLCGANVLSV